MAGRSRGITHFERHTGSPIKPSENRRGQSPVSARVTGKPEVEVCRATRPESRLQELNQQ
jgi:hypothetical protein